MSWNKAPIWGLRPDFYYCQRVAGLLMWGALSEEWTGLSFAIGAGPCQRTHSRARVPWGGAGLLLSLLGGWNSNSLLEELCFSYPLQLFAYVRIVMGTCLHLLPSNGTFSAICFNVSISL
jgi:hypothetical protein